jgi:hypothetical protein
MALKIKWADVVVGKTTTRYNVGDPSVEDIGLDERTMALIVVMKDKSIKSYFGCPYVLCQEEVADIIVPDIEIVS